MISHAHTLPTGHLPVALLLLAALAAPSPGQSSPASGQTPTGTSGAHYHLEVFPPLPGEDSMYARGMNGRGVIVGHAGDDPFDNAAQPLLVSEGTLQLLPSLGGSLDFALGLSSPQLVVGTSGGAPVAWIAGDPRFLSVPGLFSGAAHGANRAGRVCGSMFNDFTGQLFAVAWDDIDEGGVVLPVPLGFAGAQAFAVNEAGQIGGALVGGGGFVGARWDGPTALPLPIGPLPGNVSSEIVALNAHGDGAGRSVGAGGSQQAMLYRDDTGEVIGLGVLGGSFSEARALDDRRQVVGASSAPDGTAHAFLWRAGTLHDLNDLVSSSSEPFLRVSNAVAIDARGRVAVEVEIAGPTGTLTRIGRLTPAPSLLPQR